MVPANTHTDTLEEYAAFGEVTYDLTDTLEATVGVRVSSLEQYFSNTLSGTDDTPASPRPGARVNSNRDATRASPAVVSRAGTTPQKIPASSPIATAMVDDQQAPGAH